MLEVYLTAFATVFMLTTIALATYAVHLGIQTQITVKAMEKSTHSVQFVEAESVRTNVEKELNDDLHKSEHDAWDRINEIHQQNETLM